MFLPNGDARITFLGTKNDSTHTGFEVTLRKASDPQIDPVCALKDYLHCTREHRKGNTGPVFVALKKPYQALTADAIGNILQEAIQLFQGFTAKDFRANGATVAANAAKSQQDADRIVKLGRWKENLPSWTTTGTLFHRRNTSIRILF